MDMIAQIVTPQACLLWMPSIVFFLLNLYYTSQWGNFNSENGWRGHVRTYGWSGHLFTHRRGDIFILLSTVLAIDYKTLSLVPRSLSFHYIYYCYCRRSLYTALHLKGQLNSSLFAVNFNVVHCSLLSSTSGWVGRQYAVTEWIIFSHISSSKSL